MGHGRSEEFRDSIFRRQAKSLIRLTFSGLVWLFPLAWRKQVALWLFRQRRIPGHSWLALRCLDDLATSDRNSYHKFIWSNHLYYADNYEVCERFEANTGKETRRLFFAELTSFLKESGAAFDQIESVLEVGCSLGHQLRMMETEVFPSAKRLCGVDIDAYAVEQGNTHLRALGSKVRLIEGDMEALDDLLGDDRFDVVVCTGVLMYLDQESAAAVVKSILKRANYMVALSGLAHPTQHNSKLVCSETRSWDKSFIHNLERMITDVGGRAVKVLWKGDQIVDGNTVHFIFAQVGPAVAA
jgi:SAM-dependent methyltransferase